MGWQYELIRHGPKLLLIAFGIYGHWSKNQARKKAADRKLEPPKSSPGPQPMSSQTIKSQPGQPMAVKPQPMATRQALPLGQQAPPMRKAPPSQSRGTRKQDSGSPWSSGDPFS